MSAPAPPTSTKAPTPSADKIRYVPAVGPKLAKVLAFVLGLFAILSVNSTYLSAITFLEWLTAHTYQNYFYQLMFLAHLGLGLVLIVPAVAFGAIHYRNARHRKNRRAVRAGIALYVATLVMLATGVALVRFSVFELRDPIARAWVYWLHALAPLVVIWLYVLHRLAGKRIRWRVGLVWALVALGFAGGMAAMHSQDPRRWSVSGPAEGERYFFPSLARTTTGNFIPAATLMMDSYCQECHADIHRGWSSSVHRFSSFSNPAYLFSVEQTRRFSLERDGDVRASRFCAGCHDPVPFFSGAFDDPNFDLRAHATAKAGITCTACHAITHVNSVRGNADYTIEEPIHYPFATSTNPFLAWVNRQLVKAKPAFHKATFLKPLHKSPEFCGSCHKVHLPPELNHYKWLRGQNHYDTFLLSGVSGHGAQSFYYPPKAQPNCNGCHMPYQPSNDFGAKREGEGGALVVHNHHFASANTAIPHLLGFESWVNEAHAKFLTGTLRVDLFGLRQGGTIDGELIAPLRPAAPVLEPGRAYLIETVLRTLKLGHHFTQGTADSNEVWVDLTVRCGDRIIGRSGGRDGAGEVDPWSHFVNAYVLDREGRRIDRRNPEDIFVPLYNNQIPPGAADVVHYRFTVPEDARDPITITARLEYRKFDTIYFRHFTGDPQAANPLPITTIATDSVTLAVAGSDAVVPVVAPPEIPEWQRWNDYGIALLLEGGEGSVRGELHHAQAAFERVEALGMPDGPLNLARTHLRAGKVADAARALERAARHEPKAAPWTVLWLGSQVQRQEGLLAEAAATLESLIALDTVEMRERGFDFSRDYRLSNDLGEVLLEQAELVRGDDAARAKLLERAAAAFRTALAGDPEFAAAHYGLASVLARLGDAAGAEAARALHARYKLDDNARDQAILAARRADPAADHKAEAIVIFDLQRPGVFGLEEGER